MTKHIQLVCEMPWGPFEANLSIPDDLNPKESGHRRVIAKSVWETVCAAYPEKFATTLYDYSGGSPVDWINANMEVKKS